MDLCSPVFHVIQPSIQQLYKESEVRTQDNSSSLLKTVKQTSVLPLGFVVESEQPLAVLNIKQIVTAIINIRGNTSFSTLCYYYTLLLLACECHYTCTLNGWQSTLFSILSTPS